MEQLEDAAQKGKNHEHRSPMGPLKSLGALGKYPLFPPPHSVGLSRYSAIFNSYCIQKSGCNAY